MNDNPAEILLSYGGLQFMYIGNSSNLFHYEAGALIGFGGLNYFDRGANINLPNSGHIFVLEPEVSSVLNITDYIQISMGLSYRLIVGNLEKEVITDGDISGFAASFAFSFGSF